MTALEKKWRLKLETNKEILLKKSYDWDSCVDIEEDISWAIEKRLEGEWKGEIKVVVTYEESSP